MNSGCSYMSGIVVSNRLNICLSFHTHKCKCSMDINRRHLVNQYESIITLLLYACIVSLLFAINILLFVVTF